MLILKKILVLFSVGLMVLASLAYVVDITPDSGEARRTEPMVLTVGAGEEYETFKSAWKDAIDGDTIFLSAGTYSDIPILDKSVNIVGEVDDENNPLVDYLVTQYVLDDNIGISNCRFLNIQSPNQDAAFSHLAGFAWNTAGITTMAWGGGPLTDGIITGLRVTNCQFVNCRQGIFLFGAQNSVISACTFTDCYRGITIKDHYYSPSWSWISSNNQINNCNFYDTKYKDDDTGAWSDTDNGEAICIIDSDGNTINGGEMKRNTYGIRIYKGDNNRVQNVEISNTTQNPMVFREVTKGLTVSGTTVIEGGKDVLFHSCTDFIFQNNKLDGTTLNLWNSTRGDIKDNNWEQTDTPALSIGTQDRHYNHAIGQSNKIADESIYYFYNDDRLSLSRVQAGAVYVMGCNGGILSNLSVIGGDGIVVMDSNDMKIENVFSTNNLFGIDIKNAENLTIRRTDADTGGRGRFGIRLHNITDASIQDSVVRTYGTEHSIRLTGGTFCNIHNSTFDKDRVQMKWNDGGVLEVSNNLRVRVMKEGMIEPFQGANVMVTEDSSAAYATTVYGGTDAVTDKNGIVGPIKLVDRVYYRSNMPVEKYHSLQVWAEVDGIWTESRPNIDMSRSRTESFAIGDIWAPGSPRTVRLVDIPSEDAIEITWETPLEVDTAAVSLYTNMSGKWRELKRFDASNTIYKITSGLVHGQSYYFMLTAWDGEGLESLPTPVHAVVHLDGVTPPAPKNLKATNITAFSCQLNWDAVPDLDLAGYNVYINDTDGGPTGPWIEASPENGVASNLYQVNGLKSETVYFFTVTAFDEVPNESPYAPVIRVETPDVTPPPRPLLDKLPEYTNQKQQTVSGVAEAGVTVAIFIDGEEVGTAVADEEKAFALDINLTEGPNAISAQATDRAGNQGMFSAVMTVVLDTIAPEAPVLDPLPEITGDVSLLVTGVAEGDATVTLFVDGIEAGTTESIMYVGFSGRVTLTEGHNAICAQVTDRAGNVGPKCIEEDVLLDTVPPLVPELDALPTITNVPALTVTGVAEPDSTVEVYLEEYLAGSSVTNDGGRFTVAITLLEGNNFLMVRAIDLALNPSLSTLPEEILLDTIPPVVYLGPDMEVVEDTEVTFDGSTSYDNQGITGHSWSFTVDEVEQTSDAAVFKYTFDHPMEVLMTLTVTDVAGNEASGSMTVTVLTSNRAPRLTLGMVDPAEGHTGTTFTFKVTFWDADGDTGTVDMVLDGETYTMVADPSDTDSTDGVVYTYSTKLKEGDHDYHFGARDTLGFDATGPCVGDENERTLTVYKQTEAAPGMEAVLAMTAMALLGSVLVLRRRREAEAAIHRDEGVVD